MVRELNEKVICDILKANPKTQVTRKKEKIVVR